MFSPGNRRGAMVPQPIILATAGLRIKTFVFPHANIISGADVTVVPGIPGFIIRPIHWSSMKNITTVYAPTNATFNLRWGGAGSAMTGSLTPVITSAGRRYDATPITIGNYNPATIGGAALTCFPNAGNGAGVNPLNVLQFSVVYMLDPVV